MSWQDEPSAETRAAVVSQVKKKSGLRFWAVGATVRCTIKQAGKGSEGADRPTKSLEGGLIFVDGLNAHLLHSWWPLML